MQAQKRPQFKAKNKKQKQNQNNNGRKTKPNAKTIRNRRRRQNRNKNTVKGTSNKTLTTFPRGLKSGGFATNRKQQIISEDETIGIITSPNTTAFSVLGVYPINPGQAQTFPWLSKIAANYEKYEFLMLEFYVVPQVSQYATGGQTGEVILVVDFDAADAQPAAYQNATDIDPHHTDMPYVRQGLSLSPKDLNRAMDAHYVRPAGLPGSADIKTYDAGNFFLCSTGLNASSFTLCSLHVRYVCRLMVPVLETTTVAPANNSVTFFYDTKAMTTATPYQPLFVNPASSTIVNVNGLSVVNTAGSIVLPVGNYLVDYGTTFYGSSQNLTNAVTDFYKNGNQQNQENRTYITSGFGVSSITGSTFTSSNGTDAYTMSATATFATGTCNANSFIRFVAI